VPAWPAPTISALGCSFLASARDGAKAGVQQGATNVERLSASEDAFQDFTYDDPWIANGISIVVRQNGGIDGYVSVELWTGFDGGCVWWVWMVGR
jgi:hypothetical protein